MRIYMVSKFVPFTSVCPDCGALVDDKYKHNEFHEQLTYSIADAGRPRLYGE